MVEGEVVEGDVADGEGEFVSGVDGVWANAVDSIRLATAAPSTIFFMVPPCGNGKRYFADENAFFVRLMGQRPCAEARSGIFSREFREQRISENCRIAQRVPADRLLRQPILKMKQA
jgi:hypothetical protein